MRDIKQKIKERERYKERYVPAEVDESEELQPVEVRREAGHIVPAHDNIYI